MLSRLDDFESAPFDDTKDEQTSSVRVSWTWFGSPSLL
jgi:hypothetical protein